MRAATYSDRPTWQATTRPVHDMTRDREELNEVRVIKKLVAARAVLSIQLVGGDAPVSVPLQTLLLMTAITLIPSMLLVLTAFTRIIVVLALLRQALGGS